jgi:hypothetical protein
MMDFPAYAAPVPDPMMITHHAREVQDHPVQPAE